MDARAERNGDACECEWGESASAAELGSLQVWNWKPPKGSNRSYSIPEDGHGAEELVATIVTATTIAATAVPFSSDPSASGSRSWHKSPHDMLIAKPEDISICPSTEYSCRAEQNTVLTRAADHQSPNLQPECYHKNTVLALSIALHGQEMVLSHVVLSKSASVLPA
ncbi:hypothetical protein GUJ93_ZPchr0006g44559 [Zizania palustris]|uniref:Uncharacterized protein n=1 Tax=Zizania palustris TaxID=103762 RepID=A0A8J5SBR2_ZIZPA|nr:hypothetical protein GUJ93_ZPchr0006g44559 [Zizania palustris]